MRKQLTEMNPKFFNKMPYFKHVKDQVSIDVVGLWTKAGLPVLSKQRIEAKLKDLIEQHKPLYNSALRRQI